MAPPHLALLNHLQPRDWLQMAILFVVLYLFLRFLRRTIAGGIFRGPAMLSWIVILSVFLTLQHLQLDVLNNIFRGAFPILILALVVTFQIELRHGIARLGRRGLLRRYLDREAPEAPEIRVVNEIIKAVTDFARKRVGALIAIERNIDLGTYIDTGVPMDALIRAETLDTIFNTDTVLHDGAVIIRGDRLAAAGCILPLTERPQLARTYGTRHRAAIGLSEQSDAVILVVSEERGQIHLVERGDMTPHADAKWLRGVLNVVFAEKHGVAPRSQEDAA
jgi:diadenylate cyclase